MHWPVSGIKRLRQGGMSLIPSPSSSSVLLQRFVGFARRKSFGRPVERNEAARLLSFKIVVLVPEAETLAKPFRDRCDNYFG
jgi:hypothetical protein